MKLKRLSIQKLYGCYDYNVIFNPDVTLLYGLNGCGKTTILNIINLIITGQIYELLKYNFDKISLCYFDINTNEEYSIIVSHSERDALKVFFQNDESTIKKINRHDFFSDSVGIGYEYKDYFKKYKILNSINNLFNQIYLPVNRFANPFVEQSILDQRRGIFSNYLDKNFGLEKYSDILNQVSQLVKNRFSQINSNIAKYNDEFRDNILKFLLEFHESDITKGVKDIFSNQINIMEIVATQEAYIKILKELKIITGREETRYNNFFDEFIKSVKDVKNNAVHVKLLFTYYEILKMKQLADIAEKNELKKTIERKPIYDFLNTVNEFIGISEDRKVLKINTIGELYFTTRYGSSSVDINKLSSGEKQLIIFFANLIFRSNSKKPIIFLEDEPELSLHLSWQKIFVDKALSVNPDMQLILATHAPEIIAKHVDKAVRLEKKYVN